MSLLLFNILAKAFWARFYEILLILGLLFRICLPFFYVIFLLTFRFVEKKAANAYGACFSVKLPIFGLFFKFTCLFLQNNLASLRLIIAVSVRCASWRPYLM